MFLAPDRPRVFGHRGAAALAPENTLPSFAIAASLGAAYLELDVHATTDGVIVVHHDDVIDRTTDDSGPIKDRTWAEVGRLDAGYRFSMDGGATFPYRGQGVRIPTLDAVLRAHPAHRFNIEIKQADPAIVDEVIALLGRTHSSERTLLAAEKEPIMSAIRETAGNDIVTGSSEADVLSFFGHLEAGTLDSYDPPGVALQIPPCFGDRELVSADVLRAAHGKGLEVHVWTINQVAEIERLLDLGVDGIMSDAPGLVTAAIARRRD